MSSEIPSRLPDATALMIRQLVERGDIDGTALAQAMGWSLEELSERLDNLGAVEYREALRLLDIAGQLVVGLSPKPISVPLPRGLGASSTGSAPAPVPEEEQSEAEKLERLVLDYFESLNDMTGELTTRFISAGFLPRSILERLRFWLREAERVCPDEQAPPN